MAIKNASAVNAAMPLGFNRGNPIPLDASSVYATLAEAQAYAKDSAVAYVGQILSVNEGEVAKAYIIADEAGSLVEVGAAQEVTEDDVLEALGFAAAANGAQLVKGADGKVSWVVPSTETVEGLQTTVAALQANVDKLNGDSSAEGSVAYQIAQVVAGADESYDTLKEIADWIKSDSTGAAKMANDIAAVAEKVGESSVADQINAALKDGENEKYASASDLATANSNIEKIAGLVGETSVAAQIDAALKDGENEKYALASHTHEVSEVNGLQALLNAKADTTVTDSLANRLETLENQANKDVLATITADKVAAWDAAQENKLEGIKVGETALTIADKIAQLKINNSLVFSTEDGLGINKVHISKIYMDEGDELILDGGNA